MYWRISLFNLQKYTRYTEKYLNLSTFLPTERKIILVGSHVVDKKIKVSILNECRKYYVTKWSLQDYNLSTVFLYKKSETNFDKIVGSKPWDFRKNSYNHMWRK